MKKKHPGFAAVAAGIEAKESVGKEKADAILASATRKAGKGARAKNPALNNVKGGPFSKVQ